MVEYSRLCRVESVRVRKRALFGNFGGTAEANILSSNLIGERFFYIKKQSHRKQIDLEN